MTCNLTSFIKRGTNAWSTLLIANPGTPPYTFNFYIDNVLIYTYDGNINETSHQFYHIFNEALGLHVYKGEIVDKCSTGQKTCFEECSAIIVDTLCIAVIVPCIPNWICEQPLNGYENDGCGNRRQNPICNPPCIPNWICEQPLNGYENDGCGNRRQNPICNPLCIPLNCTFDIS